MLAVSNDSAWTSACLTIVPPRSSARLLASRLETGWLAVGEVYLTTSLVIQYLLDQYRAARRPALDWSFPDIAKGAAGLGQIRDSNDDRTAALGQAIRDARAPLSGREAARRANMSKSVLSRLELSQQVVSLEQ